MEIALLLTLIFINGLLAMSEVALLTAKRSKLSALANKGKKSAELALRISEDPTQFLSTIQIGITSIGILSGIVGEAAFAGPLSERLKLLGLDPAFSDLFSTIFVVVIVTYISITAGELVPKRIGQSRPELISSIAAPPMALLSLVAKPFVFILSITTDAILRLFGVGRHQAPVVTEDEIHAMLDEGSVAGLIEDQEREIVRNVFRLDDRKLGSMIVPRSEILFLELTSSAEELVSAAATSGRSRLPVCDGGLDSIVGVLNSNKALAAIAQGQYFVISDLMEPAMFVPETLTGMELLEHFKRERTQLAFVVDEYGGLEGLVSIQDIFDSLIGEIPSSGSAESAFVQREDGSWLFEGDISIPELMDSLKLQSVPEKDKGRYHTASGLILLLLGSIPTVGQSVIWEDWRLEVIDMDGRRIDKILASRVV